MCPPELADMVRTNGYSYPQLFGGVPMISQTNEYALRAVVHLSAIGGGPAVTEDIAEATRVPAGYLARVLRSLSKAGILTAQRGIGGGFALAKPAGRITVWDVLEATESGIGRIESCPLGIQSHGKSLCALHALLDDAIAGVERQFRAATIQELLTSERESRPLCDRSPGRASITIKGSAPPG